MQQRKSIISLLPRAPRFAALIMVLIMASSLAACSSGADSGSSSDAAISSETETADDNTPAEEGATDSSASITAIKEFTTVDLDGKEVTQDVFSEADITMINFWGTFCGPCVKEMPEMPKLIDKYEGRLQIIGVPLDVNFDDADSAEYKSARKILEWADAGFRNIRPSGDIENYMTNVQYVPTTIFVDPEGNIIGEPVVGAMTEEYRARIDDYLEQNAA